MTVVFNQHEQCPCDTFHASEEIWTHFYCILSIYLVQFVVQVLSSGLAITFLLQQFDLGVLLPIVVTLVEK